MDRQILNFTANEQTLICHNPIRISTNKVNYIQAVFDLGQNWSGYDSVRAVWFNDFKCISTVLDSQGVTFVPFEVMKRNGKVKVNLVGSISENDVLTDRLTSYPVVAVIVDCTAMVTGAETSPITPSQFEQYVAIVRSLVAGVRDIDHIELNSDYTLTIYYSDGTSETTTSIRGADGNGIASVTKTGTSGLVDTYTITYTDGQTTTFTVTNGAKGDTGNGIQSIAKTSTVGLVDTYTITYTDGTTTTFTVTNGEKGEKGDTGEVSLATLESLMPTDSASGSIASFPDGQAVFGAKSVKVTLEPIQSGSGTPSPDNVRPIYGRTECEVTRTGKNLIDFADASVQPTADINSTYNPLWAELYGTYAENTQYTFSCVADTTDTAKAWGIAVQYTDGTSDYLWIHQGSTNRPSVTTASGKTVRKLEFAYNSNINLGFSNAQLELGSTATSYEPYQGDTYTTQFGQTVYGGTLDVVSGVLTVTMAIADMGSLSWSGTSPVFGASVSGLKYVGDAVVINAKCDRYIAISKTDWNNQPSVEGVFRSDNAAPKIYVRDSAYENASDFESAMNGVQLVYELATPQTYQLTPTEVQTLLGDNNIWSDSGDVEVVYVADIQRYIDKKLS